MVITENGHAGNGHVAPVPILNEWVVTRKLRVTQQGSYTSSYAINGLPCTLTDLHEQLHKLRIYPEGYNVVLARRRNQHYFHEPTGAAGNY